MNRDQKFYDMYSLVIGLLALFALFIFVFSMKVSSRTSDIYNAEGEEYRESVEARLKPFGEVFMPGDDLSAAGTEVPPADAAEPVAAVKSGPQVFNEACNVCHGAGIGGAPTLSDAANWEARIAQGMDMLVDHAINGYTGDAGYMPPKGGNMSLSDDEVAAAVEFMVGEVQGQ